MSKVTTNVRSAVFWPWHRPTIVSPLVYCSKSAHKFAVQVCQVATVVMETTQVKKLFTLVNW